MNKKKLKEYKNLFLQKRKEIIEKSLRSEEDTPDMDGDEIDEIQGKILLDIVNSLSQRDTAMLNKIEAALKRIEDGSFGVCEECGCDITESRLKARPEASLCIDCAENMENLKKQFG